MAFAWRMGFPGWRIAASMGLPIKVKVEVCRDDEAGVYYATSNDIGLAVESESLDGIVKEIEAAAAALLALAHTPAIKTRADIRYRSNLAMA